MPDDKNASNEVEVSLRLGYDPQRSGVVRVATNVITFEFFNMLNLLQPARATATLCNGMRRREFLQIGCLAQGGLNLKPLLAAEAQTGARSKHKSVIMIYETSWISRPGR